MSKTSHEHPHESGTDIVMLTPSEARRLIDGGEVLLIDVGEEWQLRERGTIAGARHISRGELEATARLDEGRRDPALQDRNRKIMLTCGGGGKASSAAAVLREAGFTDVSVIQGGCRGWQRAGYPLEAYAADAQGANRQEP